MPTFYTCEKCGGEYSDKGTPHESYCPGSPDERICTLEGEIEELRTAVAALVWLVKNPGPKPEPWVSLALTEALKRWAP